MNLSGVKRVRPLSCLCAALVAGLCGIPARSQAQSFDCGKASTAIERAICADKALGRLDESLAAELKRVLAAAPALRGALLAGERHWVAARDRQCGTGDAPERMPVCLATAYRARIAALQTGTAQQLAATYATATCRKIADRYRVLADAHPGESVLDTLSTTPGSGISVSQTLQSGSATERLSLAERARRLEPPFEIPEDLSKKVSNESGPHPGIAKLPNANFYWAGTLEGTLHCYSSTYFVVRGGRAQQVGAPPGFEEEETCGVLRKFGTVDADAVYFEEDALVGPSMTESLGVATWDGDRFPAFCGMTFKHAPQFTREMKNSWDVSCDGTSCEGLRQEAFRLVALAQGDPSAARRQALAALPDAQRTAYAAAEKLAIASRVAQSPAAGVPATAMPAAPLPGGKEARQADSLTREAPLFLPLGFQGHLYVVSLGHFLMWDNVYPDWNATFDELEDGRLVRRASLAVGMRTGQLLDIAIAAGGRN